MINHVTFTGALVNDPELIYGKSGKAFMRLTLAINYSEKIEEEYREIGTSFRNVSVFGRTAELIAESNIPKGTTLVIDGFVKGRIVPEFQTKRGEIVPEHFKEQFIANTVAVSIERGKCVDVRPSNSKGTKKDSSTKENSKQGVKNTTKKAQPQKKQETAKKDQEFDNPYPSKTQNGFKTFDQEDFDDIFASPQNDNVFEVEDDDVPF